MRNYFGLTMIFYALILQGVLFYSVWFDLILLFCFRSEEEGASKALAMGYRPITNRDELLSFMRHCELLLREKLS